jgi:hypothetical protein
MSSNNLKMWLVLAICLAGLVSSAYGTCNPSTATQIGTAVVPGQTVTLTPNNGHYSSSITYTYLWTVNYYASGTTSNPTQINVYDQNGQLANQVQSSAAPSTLPVTFTIPSNANPGDYYTIELQIQAGSGCIDDLCIGKIVVASPGVTITQTTPSPVPPEPGTLCVSTDPSTYLITYTANPVGTPSSFLWSIDQNTLAPDSSTHTVDWHTYTGHHTVNVEILYGTANQATNSISVDVYWKPTASASVHVA